MVFKISFTKEEIERLYLTYHRNPQNYTEIKKRLFGQSAKLELKKNMRARFLFIAALTVVALVGSTFSFFVSHWGSFGAIWLIWGAFAIGVGTSIFFLYKNGLLVMEKNERFFQDFEQYANNASTLSDFRIDWNTRR